jgi:hypothetical protein
MNEVNELWSSAWRNLQKNLASSYGIDGSSHEILFCAPQATGRMASSNSWLARARSREVQVSRAIQ